MLSSASFALLLLASAPAAPAPDAAERFFVGRTESVGTVSVALSGSHKVRDRTVGPSHWTVARRTVVPSHRTNRVAPCRTEQGLKTG